jgi:hypothetical protein
MTGALSAALRDGRYVDGAMDLTSAIVGLRQAQTMSAVQMRVAKKVLDMQQFQGDAAVKLIEAAARSGAQAGDEMVAAATGLGGSLDTYA